MIGWEDYTGSRRRPLDSNSTGPAHPLDATDLTAMDRHQFGGTDATVSRCTWTRVAAGGGLQSRLLPNTVAAPAAPATVNLLPRHFASVSQRERVQLS